MKNYNIILYNLFAYYEKIANFIYLSANKLIGNGFVNNILIKKIKDKSVIERYFSHSIKQIVSPPTIHPKSTKINHDDLNKFNNDIGKIIILFEELMKTNNISIPYFYKNYNSLKIDMHHNYENKTVEGSYNSKNNVISINSENINTIFHELLHCASSIKNKTQNVYLSGFHQLTKESQSIGKGINEGYTEHLTQNLFNYQSTSYYFETCVLEFISKIVGEKKLQELYFRADLNGLINEISKYNNKNEIYKFIINLDFISDNIRENNSNYLKEKINVIIREIYEFLVETYSNFRDLSNSKFWFTKEEEIDIFKNQYLDMLKTYNVNINFDEIKKK